MNPQITQMGADFSNWSNSTGLENRNRVEFEAVGKGAER